MPPTMSRLQQVTSLTQLVVERTLSLPAEHRWESHRIHQLAQVTTAPERGSASQGPQCVLERGSAK